MFSRCPHCDQQQAVSTLELREGRGLLNCSECGRRFDALATLSDERDDPIAMPRERRLLFLESSETLEHANVWWLANLLMLGVFVVQVVYFERDRLLTFRPMRSLISSAATLAGYRSVVRGDADQWSLSHAELERVGNGHFVFKALLTNQSDAYLMFPALKLTLTDFNGLAIAERIFDADMLGEGELVAGMSQPVRFDLVVGRDDVGGFLYSLM